MNTHTHTPSPWHPVTLGASPDHAWAIDSELVEIARLSEWPYNQAEAEANARLIASAPDLLAALKDAEALLFLLGKEHEETGGIDYNADFISGTRNELLLSIAKAEGGDA